MYKIALVQLEDLSEGGSSGAHESLLSTGSLSVCLPTSPTSETQSTSRQSQEAPQVVGGIQTPAPTGARRSTLKKEDRGLLKALKGILEHQLAAFQKLESIQQNGSADLGGNEDFENSPQGHFVMVTCGHRGLPPRPEEKRISRLLRKSGFLPMLEGQQLPDQNKKKFTEEGNEKHSRRQAKNEKEQPR